MIALSVGVFDGVHLGHRRLLQTLKEQGCRAVALTFSNHPAEVLAGKALSQLTPLPLKLALLKEMGLDEVIALPFTRALASQSYQEFLAPYPIRRLILGEGDAFGKGRQGTEQTLRLLGLQRGFAVDVVPKLRDGGEVISSTRIRALLVDGDLKGVERLLGRPYCFLPGKGHIALPPDGEYKAWLYSAEIGRAHV